MLAKLLILFTVIPVLELCVLIPMGTHVGLAPTIGLIVFTAVAGAILGSRQGKAAWQRIKAQSSGGELPTDSLLDGLAVIVASAFLVTPGVLTDLAGFALLIPFTRRPIRAFAKRRVLAWLEGENVGMFGSTGAGFMGMNNMANMAGFADEPSTVHPTDEDWVVVEDAPKAPQATSRTEPEVITIG